MIKGNGNHCPFFIQFFLILYGILLSMGNKEDLLKDELKNELLEIIDNKLEDKKEEMTSEINTVLDKFKKDFKYDTSLLKLEFKNEVKTDIVNLFDEKLTSQRMQISELFSNAIDSIRAETINFEDRAKEIAEQSIHEVVNGKLDEIKDSVLEINDYVRRKTIHGAIFNNLNNKPIRTTFILTVITGIIGVIILDSFGFIEINGEFLLDIIKLIKF